MDDSALRRLAWIARMSLSTSRVGARIAGRKSPYNHGRKVSARINRAERLVLNGKFARALKAYSRILEAYPDSPLPRLGMAAALFSLGRHGEATVECDRAIGLEAGYLASYGYGDGVPESGRAVGDADAAHGHSVSLNPNYSFYHASCGNSLYRMGRHEEALASYARAVERDPNYSYYHANCGEALSKLGRHEEALGAHVRAAELEPDSVFYHANCGDELSELGRHKEALASYVRAVGLKPNWAWVRSCCVDALKAVGRGEGAAEGGGR